VPPPAGRATAVAAAAAAAATAWGSLLYRWDWPEVLAPMESCQRDPDPDLAQAWQGPVGLGHVPSARRPSRAGMTFRWSDAGRLRENLWSTKPAPAQQ